MRKVVVSEQSSFFTTESLNFRSLTDPNEDHYDYYMYVHLSQCIILSDIWVTVPTGPSEHVGSPSFWDLSQLFCIRQEAVYWGDKAVWICCLLKRIVRATRIRSFLSLTYVCARPLCYLVSMEKSEAKCILGVEAGRKQ